MLFILRAPRPGDTFACAMRSKDERALIRVRTFVRRRCALCNEFVQADVSIGNSMNSCRVPPVDYFITNAIKPFGSEIHLRAMEIIRRMGFNEIHG